MTIFIEVTDVEDEGGTEMVNTASIVRVYGRNIRTVLILNEYRENEDGINSRHVKIIQEPYEQVRRQLLGLNEPRCRKEERVNGG